MKTTGVTALSGPGRRFTPHSRRVPPIALRREALWGKEALDNPDLLMPPSSVAASYWQLYQQPKSAWTFELEIRPFGEKW